MSENITKNMTFPKELKIFLSKIRSIQKNWKKWFFEGLRPQNKIFLKNHTFLKNWGRKGPKKWSKIWKRKVIFWFMTYLWFIFNYFFAVNQTNTSLNCHHWTRLWVEFLYFTLTTYHFWVSTISLLVILCT